MDNVKGVCVFSLKFGIHCVDTDWLKPHARDWTGRVTSCQVPRHPASHDGPAGRREDAGGGCAREAEAELGGQDAGHLARLEAQGMGEEVKLKKCSGGSPVK